jgi:hypothetical protein
MYSRDGGITTVDDIATWGDCERIRLRTEYQSSQTTPYPVHGVCTQYRKNVVVPDQANVKVTPTINVPVPSINLTVKNEKPNN